MVKKKVSLALILIILLSFVLRFYNLSSVPPALNWDEASLGYNAFSVSKTLKDEHGEFLPVARFIAYGDYKPPGYIYAAAPVIGLLGLNEFSTRLPSALAGVLLVLVTYFLARNLNFNRKISLSASFLVAISPWAIQFSRGAFEANLATLFTAIGAFCYLKVINKKGSFIALFFAALFFAASMYTFNSHRIFTPLLVGLLILVHLFKDRLSSLRLIIPFGILMLLFLLPLAPYMMSRESKLRFEEVTWLNDVDPIKVSNERISREGNTLAAKLIHNRRVVYGLEFLKHYSDNFRGDFLFFSGDINPRLGIQTVGIFYLVELPLLLAGLYYLIKYKRIEAIILIGWVILAPIPGSFARETPHALRILNMIPSPQIISAIGLVFLATKWRLLKPVLYLSILGLFFLYLHDYYIHYPNKYAISWQYGYKQAVEFVTEVQDKYDSVVVTESYGRPYIYFLYYNSYSPEKYLQTRSADRDWFGFWYIHGFDKYKFGQVDKPQGKTLFVDTTEGTPGNAKILKTVTGPKGEVLFVISERG